MTLFKPRALALGAALMLAACGGGTDAVQTPASGASTEAAACSAQGGELKGVCRMQTVQCVVPYADAGKPCTDGDQCAGDCLAPDGEPGHTAGVCQADNDPCGCRFTIEDGRPDQGICVD